MFYSRILSELNSSQLTYAIIGGVAVNLHGYLRATGDLDIVILLTDEEISKFISVVNKIKMVPRLPVKLEDFADSDKRTEWIEEKNMLVFSVYNPNDPREHIDVKIAEPEEFETIIKNRVIMKDGDLELPVASIEDLIEMKKRAGRDRDLIDIKALRKIQEI